MKWIKKWEVEGSRGAKHIVSLSDDGTYGCSCPCPVWKYKRKDCKHVLRVMAGIANGYFGGITEIALLREGTDESIYKDDYQEVYTKKTGSRREAVSETPLTAMQEIITNAKWRF